MVRLKILVLASFLILHILNFSTPLSPTAAVTRHVKHSPVVLPQCVDITSPAISLVLDVLSVREFEASELIDEDVDVCVVPPMYVHILPLAAAHPNLSFLSHAGSFESFMSSWSSLVGDPVISKWIVVLLFVSRRPCSDY
ncbi:hypothetical protein QCA50_012612 [Cerrena zonata]|uniref:Uncharacterized protein n=1 Tax=Cerrena zonata TaxID=2478898 RepID=A0AAW0G2Y6_9APHY